VQQYHLYHEHHLAPNNRQVHQILLNLLHHQILLNHLVHHHRQILLNRQILQILQILRNMLLYTVMLSLLVHYLLLEMMSYLEFVHDDYEATHQISYDENSYFD
jgi:hypothetical protein